MRSIYKPLVISLDGLNFNKKAPSYVAHSYVCFIVVCFLCVILERELQDHFGLSIFLLCTCGCLTNQAVKLRGQL